MKHKIFLTLACLAVIVTFVAAGVCATKVVKNEKTKEEMLSGIQDNLETFDEILGMIPAIKAEKDAAGKLCYTYEGRRLEDMGKEDLEKLYSKVGQLAVKFRTERIERQLETVKRAQVISAPRMPPAPPQPAQPPRVPTAPPSPPKRAQ